MSRSTRYSRSRPPQALPLSLSSRAGCRIATHGSAGISGETYVWPLQTFVRRGRRRRRGNARARWWRHHRGFLDTRNARGSARGSVAEVGTSVGGARRIFGIQNAATERAVRAYAPLHRNRHASAVFDAGGTLSLQVARRVGRG